MSQLPLTIEEKKAAHKALVAETIAARRLEMELVRMDSPAFLEKEIEKSNNLTLTAILAMFEELSTGTDKAIKPVFGYGVQADKLLTILRSMQFAKREYREAMEAIAPIDEELIEDTLDALGSPAYYSPTTAQLIPEILPDLPTLRVNLTAIALDLGLTSVKLHKLTDAHITWMYSRALSKQTAIMENTLAYNDEQPTQYTV